MRTVILLRDLGGRPGRIAALAFLRPHGWFSPWLPPRPRPRARAYDAAAMKKARGDQPGLLAQF
jgi:hypothetical protein